MLVIVRNTDLHTSMHAVGSTCIHNMFGGLCAVPLMLAGLTKRQAREAWSVIQSRLATAVDEMKTAKGTARTDLHARPISNVCCSSMDIQRLHTHGSHETLPSESLPCHFWMAYMGSHAQSVVNVGSVRIWSIMIVSKADFGAACSGVLGRGGVGYSGRRRRSAVR
jgi:hypothetical protein